MKFIVSKKRNFGPFWLFLTTMADIEQHLLGSTRYVGSYGASCKTISLTRKRLLKTQLFEKKAIVPLEKDLGQSFPVLSKFTKLKK